MAEQITEIELTDEQRGLVLGRADEFLRIKELRNPDLAHYFEAKSRYEVPHDFVAGQIILTATVDLLQSANNNERYPQQNVISIGVVVYDDDNNPLLVKIPLSDNILSFYEDNPNIANIRLDMNKLSGNPSKDMTVLMNYITKVQPLILDFIMTGEIKRNVERELTVLPIINGMKTHEILSLMDQFYNPFVSEYSLENSLDVLPGFLLVYNPNTPDKQEDSLVNSQKNTSLREFLGFGRRRGIPQGV